MNILKKGIIFCDECKEEKQKAVHLGMERDYDTYSFHICKECLTKAINLINETI